MPRSAHARASGLDPKPGLPPEEARALYDRLGVVLRAVRAAADVEYARLGIGNAQAKFVRHLGVQSRLSQADLARATSAAPTLTGRALESLIERGWVRRRRSADDRRQYLLELTAAGQRARE
ncbi:MAG TPA: MarR family winged helix-turn-helix transcriptional regulator, partial [Polyangia bacterium]|nr:MarR family winged helix-turn-helix transcriptional regulator [Polyangia bacterium]